MWLLRCGAGGEYHLTSQIDSAGNIVRVGSGGEVCTIDKDTERE